MATDCADNAQRAVNAQRLTFVEPALNLDKPFQPEAALLTEPIPSAEAIDASVAPPDRKSDDVAEIRDAVFRYLELLNDGDVATRASCSLSDATSFGTDGGPLSQNVLDWRTANLEAGANYDLRCRDLRVYIHNDTAIATGYVVGTISGRNGNAKKVTGRGSWVHLRQNGEWKLAHNHLSPLKSVSV